METQLVNLNDGSKQDRLVIYTITTLSVRPVKDEVKREVLGEVVEFSKTTTPGWYSSLEKAMECVENGWGSLDECGYYNYLVIERVVEGLYNLAGSDVDKPLDWWYKYDGNQWTPCERPSVFRQVHGFWQ